MISDFIEEFDGFLKLSDEQYDGIHDEEEKPSKKEAREMLHYGAEREGCRDNAKFMIQVGLAEQIARPSEKFNILWLFDQSSGNTAMAADALVATRMNVSDGVAQPKMHDTISSRRR